jgi:hypothetical protein
MRMFVGGGGGGDDAGSLDREEKRPAYADDGMKWK